MSKKMVSLLIMLVLLISLVACGQNKVNDDSLHLGINAKILAIDLKKCTLTLEGIEESDKERLTIPSDFDCKASDIIKLDKNDEPVFITLGELKVGDHVALAIYQSELDKLGEKVLPKPRHVQLLKK